MKLTTAWKKYKEQLEEENRRNIEDAEGINRFRLSVKGGSAILVYPHLNTLSFEDFMDWCVKNKIDL